MLKPATGIKHFINKLLLQDVRISKVVLTLKGCMKVNVASLIPTPWPFLNLRTMTDLKYGFQLGCRKPFSVPSCKVFCLFVDF